MQSVENGDNANGWQVGLTHEHVIQHKNKADDTCEVLIQHSKFSTSLDPNPVITSLH